MLSNALQARLSTVSTTFELARVLREAGFIDRVREGTIYSSQGSMVGHYLWKPWRKGKRAREPWGYAPGHAGRLLDWERS